jgi:hypothetical protein
VQADLIRPRRQTAFGHLENASLLNATHGKIDLNLDGTVLRTFAMRLASGTPTITILNW